MSLPLLNFLIGWLFLTKMCLASGRKMYRFWVRSTVGIEHHPYTDMFLELVSTGYLCMLLYGLNNLWLESTLYIFFVNMFCAVLMLFSYIQDLPYRLRYVY